MGSDMPDGGERIFGGPSWALAATAALMASSRWVRKLSR